MFGGQSGGTIPDLIRQSVEANTSSLLRARAIGPSPAAADVWRPPRAEQRAAGEQREDDRSEVLSERPPRFAGDKWLRGTMGSCSLRSSDGEHSSAPHDAARLT